MLRISDPLERGLLKKLLLTCGFLWPLFLLRERLQAQIDPVSRQLIQLGFNQPIEGRGPLGAYAFYYHNQPGFIRTNLTMRLVVAPTYLDSELGVADALGPATDVGFGIAGGGFADSYFEIRRGKLFREESFTGHGAETTMAIYHGFNPLPPGSTPTSLWEIPLQAILRGSMRYSFYSRDDETSPGFVVPEDKLQGEVRAGLRWGGREPLMQVAQAFELSAWYEGQFRTDTPAYGYQGDRDIESQSHLFWGRALMAYGFKNRMHIEASITGGTSMQSDRFSAYRLGGALPLASEFPLMIPGYYFQEISGERFVLLNGNYSVPLGKNFEFMLVGSTAWVDYVPGLELNGRHLSGAGGAFGWTSLNNKLHLLFGYGYGFDAIRGATEGAHSIGFLLQYDLERVGEPVQPSIQKVRRAVRQLNPATWRGFDRIFGR